MRRPQMNYVFKWKNKDPDSLFTTRVLMDTPHHIESKLSCSKLNLQTGIQ